MAAILICDDEQAIREMLKEVLVMQSHSVDTAENGKEAVEAVKKKPYDLLVIDRNMPVMTGIQAIQLIRLSPQFKGLKILMFTSASVTKEVDEAYAAGANGYLVKPLNLKQFSDKVAAVLKPA